MTNARAILYLTATLLLTGLANFVLHYQGGISQSLTRRMYLLESGAEQALRISVERQNSTKAELIHARKWRLTEPFSALADEEIVLKMIDLLMTTEIEAATGNQELLKIGKTREDFGLTSPSLKLTFFMPNAEAEISFGLPTPSGDGYYATIKGEDVVYVVSSNVFAAANLSANEFRRRNVYSVGSDAVLSLDVKRGTGSFMRFVREGELWEMTKPKKISASATRIKGLLDGVMSATITDFIWPIGANDESKVVTDAMLAGYGLDSESAVTLTMNCIDGVNRQMSLGKTASINSVYALIHTASAIVTVPSYIKDAAIAGISDFTDTRLFPVEEDSITRISIDDGGTSYLLAKNELGSWRMESPVVAATDSANVSSFLKRICMLRLEHIETNGIAIAMTPGEKTRIVSRDVALGNFRLESLRSREILSIEESQVRRLVVSDLRNKSKSSVVYDLERNAWNVEATGKTGIVNEEALTQVLNEIKSLTASEVVKLKVSAAEFRAFSLDAPLYTLAIDLRQKDAVRKNILIGKETPYGFYATLGASDAVFLLPKETVMRLVSSLVNEK